MALQHYPGNKTNGSKRLNRMLRAHMDNSGVIRFKYYGEFDVMKKIHNDCQDDLTYIGNSNLDGSPIFVYEYNDFDVNTIMDFKALNLVIRKIKLKHYSKQELTKKEKSIRTFFKFFMIAFDNYEIKGLSDYEIKYVIPI